MRVLAKIEELGAPNWQFEIFKASIFSQETTLYSDSHKNALTY